MKKIILKLSSFVFCFFLIACSSQINSLPKEYVVSNSMINQYLKSYLGQKQSIGLSGLAEASLAFNNFNVDIGQEDADKVSLSGGINFAISSLIGGSSAGFDVKVKARPVYEPEKGAIYLKDLELNNFSLNSSLGSVNSSALSPYLNSALQYYFNERPVYTLSPAASVFKNVITDMKVEQGKIVFRLAK